VREVQFSWEAGRGALLPNPAPKSETRAGFSPGGPTSSATLPPPVHPRSAARSRATAFI